MTEKHEAAAVADHNRGVAKYLIVYGAILVLAGLQFVLAYQHVDVTAMIFRMFAVAILEAGLVMMYFMHLDSENRVFVAWLAIVIIFVVGILQFVWTDSYRMERDAPGRFQQGPQQ